MVESQSFCSELTEFPCNSTVMTVIAFSAVAGFLVLLMVLYLIRKVRKTKTAFESDKSIDE
jgi:hypothetical protein